MLSTVICLLFAPNTLYVSPAGSDLFPGSAKAPFASLAAAKDAARGLGVHTIVVKGGTYNLSQSLELDNRDSGLTIRVESGQHAMVSGGLSIPSTAIHPCTDASILNRIIDSSARSGVMEVDLGALGIQKLDPIQARGFPHGASPAPNELYEGHSVMTLARWPNTGFAKVGKVDEPGNGEHDHDKPARRPIFSIGDRAKGWGSAEDAWMYGYWKFDWADESIRVHGVDAGSGAITLESPAVYGVDAGTPFFAENLIEELDAPGEYYIDRTNRKLYFIPGAKPAPITMSTLSQPLITINGGSNIKVQGLTFAYSRGTAASIVKGDHVQFAGCRFENLGAMAASIAQSRDCGLQSCDITATGEGGVRLSGGDRATLVAGNNYVDNCDIWNFERRSQTYRPAVMLDGVGNRVTHCYIHDAPHSAIIYGGNNHHIEFNHFARTITLTGDGGVVYTGRDWTARGTVIQGNWFEDNVGQRKWEPAIYVDDLGSGIQMIGNLIERCHWGFLIGGGRDNVLKDNVLIDCDLAFDCDARGLGWAATSRPTMMERLNAMPYQSEVWAKSYPGLVNSLTETPMAPAGNILQGNVLIHSGKVTERMEKPFETTSKIVENSALPAMSPREGNHIAMLKRASGLHLDGFRKKL